jgi:hypothetical protein
MALKKPVRPKTSAGAKKASRAKVKSGTLGTAVILMALVCVAALTVLVAARESLDGRQITTVDRQLSMAEKIPAKKIATSRTSVPALTPAPTTGVMVADEPGTDESSDARSKKPSPVTIAGCLERASKAFRLTDATGADVPKSRSWKSGFLKKGSASIDLVESGNGLRLRDHVGKRVSVTGTLTERRMRVQSVRRVAPSCR